MFHRDVDSHLLDPIFTDFGKGFGCGLERLSSEDLLRHQEHVSWERRNFFREGYAFGLSARHVIGRHAGNPERWNSERGTYRIMHYTGYGFFNGCAESLGMTRLPEDADSWRDVADYAKFRPFLSGGRSFGRMVRSRVVTRDLLRSFEHEETRLLTEAAWHGCGRAFWFRAPAAPEALCRLLELYPPATDCITWGLGVAMTLTQIANPDAVERSLQSMPERFQPTLMRGSGIALAAMVHENPDQEQRVRSLYAGRSWYPMLDAAIAAFEASTDDAQVYAAVLDSAASAPAIRLAGTRG